MIQNLVEKVEQLLGTKHSAKYIILLVPIVIGLALAAIWSLVTLQWEWLLKTTSSLTIALGVIIALANLRSTEQARQKESEREESRFRYEIRISELGRLREILQPTENFVAGHPTPQWNNNTLVRANRVIKTYTELKADILPAHLAALEIEEQTLRDEISSWFKQLSLRDYLRLLNWVDDGTAVAAAVKAHNKYVSELKAQLGEENREWLRTSSPTDKQTPFPSSLSAIELAKLIKFVGPSELSMYMAKPTKERESLYACILGVGKLEEYFMLCEAYENTDGQLHIPDKAKESIMAASD